MDFYFNWKKKYSYVSPAKDDSKTLSILFCFELYFWNPLINYY